MKKISVLDCTLRDGGYCNQWKFGKQNIGRIINALVEADVEIIECGFLTKKREYDMESTQFTSPLQVSSFIPANKHGKLFVCMVNYGEYPIEELPSAEATSLDGIRVAFHKRDMLGAMAYCRQLKEKGYMVFVQPMVSLSYTDEEFGQLISLANDIAPYAFYIVDSFGVMKRKSLLRLYSIVEEQLDEGIVVGYHSHNNMQLAYSNAQSLADIDTSREIIIDSSIFGMGRGAGNLNTELFVEYLNDNCGKSYVLRPLLIVIDEILNNFHETNYWGYSLPNYLSAKHNAVASQLK
jgi:4-hydroxy 2-oxovalerate aldolase